ncbi:hypothetical protein [Flavobacterium sp.]|uniref:hypothetical protein n=1 Tax=Flavobacterium sp. TaxID=239 RepID=UPI0037C11E86
MKIQLILGLVSIVIASSNANAQQSMNYNDSPLNYKNSELNYDNSPLNYKNSPLNYENSQLNYNAKNGVYDNNGNRIGYEVQAPSGVTNIYSNDGRRMGYVPSPQR